MRKVRTEELGESLADALSGLDVQSELLIEHKGDPVAVVLSPARYEALSGKRHARAPRVRIEPAAADFLLELPRWLRFRIRWRMWRLGRKPRPADARMLRNGALRIAVGPQRIIYRPTDPGVFVERIGPRDEVYASLAGVITEVPSTGRTR